MAIPQVCTRLLRASWPDLIATWLHGRGDGRSGNSGVRMPYATLDAATESSSSRAALRVGLEWPLWPPAPFVASSESLRSPHRRGRARQTIRQLPCEGVPARSGWRRDDRGLGASMIACPLATHRASVRARPSGRDSRPRAGVSGSRSGSIVGTHLAVHVVERTGRVGSRCLRRSSA